MTVGGVAWECRVTPSGIAVRVNNPSIFCIARCRRSLVAACPICVHTKHALGYHWVCGRVSRASVTANTAAGRGVLFEGGAAERVDSYGAVHIIDSGVV